MYKGLKYSTLTTAILSALLITGCGGGGSSSSSGSSDGGSVEAASVSGTVADGYLVGATVCLDVNQNKTCDINEPNSVTGANGAYAIDLPDGLNADDHPVLVEVGSDTIDMDTNAPVGSAYVLSAPAGKPGFVSPLTTMVQSKIESNPGMTADEAEGLIKSNLGTEAGLFEDYVSAKQDSGNLNADEFERLHKVAQVTARILADNIEAVEAAAAAASLDPADVLDELVKIVVKEVIEQLDTIVSAVDSTAAESFDADTAAGTLTVIDTTDLSDDVATEQLVSTITARSVQDILADGVNWLGGHPGHQYYDPETDTNIVEPPEFERGRISLDETGERLTEAQYEYDHELGGFVLDADNHTDLVLTSNGFVEVSDAASNWVPTFNSDNSVTISMTDSSGVVIWTENVKGSGLDVSEKPMRELMHEGLDGALVNPDAVFPAGSMAYHWHFTTLNDLYELDSWMPDDDGMVNCGDGVAVSTYNGNCNVAYGYDSSIQVTSTHSPGQTMPGPATTLAEILYPASHDFSVPSYEMMYIGEMENGSLGVQLVAGSSADAGTVRFVNRPHNFELAPSLLTTGSWSKVMVGTTEIIKFAVPSTLRSSMWDGKDGGPESRVILAVHDGFVRRGTFVPEGTVEYEDEWNFNDTAMQAILDNFQAPVSIEPQPSP